MAGFFTKLGNSKLGNCIDKLVQTEEKPHTDADHICSMSDEDWIPCSNGLPDSLLPVLITLENSEYPQIGFMEDGYWYHSDGVIALQEDVLAWQPLPPRYKKGI